MSKFNSTRNKIFNAWKQKENNTHIISFQKDIKKYIENNIVKVNTINNIQSVSYNIDDDFQVLDSHYIYAGEVIEAWRNWRIVFDSYPEHLIIGLKPQIIKRFGESYTGELQASTSIKTNYVIEVTDIDGSNLKRVALDVGFVVLDNTGIQDDLQVKLVLSILVPNITI